MKKLCFIFSALIIFLLTVSMAYAAKAPSDISKHWAKADITSANNEGWAYVVNGKFNPNKAATREEVAWMLVGACKTVQVKGFDINKKADLTKFKDKPSSWASGRMAIAIGNGLIGGYPDKTIKPKASITRAEFAVILSRLIPEKTTVSFLPFWDYIPKWAIEGITKAYSKGLIKGYANNSFKATANVTKAEALVMIARWKKLQPPVPVPACKEFKNIVKTVKGTEIVDDNSRLYYYGPDGKTDTSREGKFYITDNENGNFHFVMSDFSDETYANLKVALKPILPTSADKLISAMKSPPESNKYEMTCDNKKILIYYFGAYISVFITK